MYNHYIQGSDGVYERKTVPQPQQTEVQPREQTAETPTATRTACPQKTDTGDLLLLCIVLLLLLDSEAEDLLPVLVMAAALVLGL